MFRKLLSKKLLIAFAILGCIHPFSLIAQTASPDYVIDPLNLNSGGSTTSSSSDFIADCQQIGDLGVGSSTDTANIIEHGYPCISPEDVILDFRFLPQGRYGPLQTNDQTTVTIEVRPTGGNASTFLFSEDVVTLADGTYAGLVLTGIAPGTYDITAKGWATTRNKKTNISLFAGINNVDFSDGGLTFAIAGDIDLTDRSGFGSEEQGDNEVSAADYSVLVGNYNLVGPVYDRIDLDQFGASATAADYSILVSNYNLTGAN